MALQITKTTSQGVDVTYWEVSPMIVIDFDTHAIHGKVMGWVSSAAKAAGKHPIDIGTINGASEVQSFTMVDEAAIDTGDPRSAMYTHLLTTDFFNGATQV